MIDGTVLSGTGGVWRVLGADGKTYECSLRGRVKQGGLKLAVGDDVGLEQDDRGEGLAIAAIHPRRSKLARRAPGGGHGERIVAANVDQVVVVFALVKPAPHPRMLDRFLVIAEANALAATSTGDDTDVFDDDADLDEVLAELDGPALRRVQRSLAGTTL